MENNAREQDRPMFTDLKAAITRSSHTLAQDFAGGAALAVILVIALHLPGLV